MTIEILNNPSQEETKESEAALELKQMLEDSTPSNVGGKLYIASNLTLCGQEVRDIDLAIWGNLSNYRLPNYYTNDPKYRKKDLVVKSFFMVLEFKRHHIEKLYFKDTHIWAKYPDKEKDVTHQSENQRYSMLSYLNSYCGFRVFVTNCIWLYSVNSLELQLLSEGCPVGALPTTFGLKDLVDVAILQNQRPFYDNNNKNYVLFAGNDANYLDQINYSNLCI